MTRKIFGEGWEREFEIAWRNMFEKDQSTSRSRVIHARTAYPVELEHVVASAIRDLRNELGKTWLPASHFGTRLHAKVAAHIRALPNSAGWWIAAEMPLRQYPGMRADLLRKRVKTFFAEEGFHIDWLKRSLPASVLNSSIGDIRPDLVVRGPDGVTTVWDLTSREREQHIAKTTLYAHLLARDNCLTRIGETYWIKF